jgi:two-component system cell cycle response regulator
MVSSQPPTEVSQANEVDLAAGTVLIVDDNPQNLELIQAYMESLPCRIVVAQDGAEAMKRIESERPDLVLLDVMMPRVSGFDVCKRIKQNPSTRDTVVIMVTALHELGDMERAVESGCDDFVSKPVNKVELLARVRGLLALRLLKRRMNSLLGKDQE